MRQHNLLLLPFVLIAAERQMFTKLLDSFVAAWQQVKEKVLNHGEAKRSDLSARSTASLHAYLFVRPLEAEEDKGTRITECMRSNSNSFFASSNSRRRNLCSRFGRLFNQLHSQRIYGKISQNYRQRTVGTTISDIRH